MIRAVIDTNVFLAALLSPFGPPARILAAWQADRILPISCPEQLEELRRVSRYAKFRGILQPHLVGRLVNNLRDAVLLDPPANDDTDLHDPDDAWMLALAALGQAAYLVTGDKRAGLLSRRRIGGTRILTAAAFCQEAL